MKKKKGTRAQARAKTNPTRLRVRPAQKPAARTSDATDALVAAAARALGLKIDPSWEIGVKFNLQLIFSHAAKVDGFPLPDDAEPASIFHA